MKKITLILIALVISFSVFSQSVLFSDDFEAEVVNATTYANWTAFDQDGDGELFEVSDITGTGIDASDLQGLVADSDSWESGNANSPMTPNNYLITSNSIDLTGATDGMLSFTFGTYQSNGTFISDQLAVYISTSNDPATIEGETPIFDDIIGNLTPANNGGENSAVTVNLDISAFEGQDVYIAFRHYNTFDQNSVLIDNVSVSSMALSLDEFELNRIKYFYNQGTKNLNIKSQVILNDLRVYNILGQEAMRSSLNSTNTDVNLSELNSGVYIAKVSAADGASKTFKLLIQ